MSDSDILAVQLFIGSGSIAALAAAMSAAGWNHRLLIWMLFILAAGLAALAFIWPSIYPHLTGSINDRLAAIANNKVAWFVLFLLATALVVTLARLRRSETNKRPSRDQESSRPARPAAELEAIGSLKEWVHVWLNDARNVGGTFAIACNALFPQGGRERLLAIGLQLVSIKGNDEFEALKARFEQGNRLSEIEKAIILYLNGIQKFQFDLAPHVVELVNTEEAKEHYEKALERDYDCVIRLREIVARYELQAMQTFISMSLLPAKERKRAPPTYLA